MGGEMDGKLLQELASVDRDSLDTIEYIEKCLDIYRETLNAMGLLPLETVGQTVINSQLVYANPPELQDNYGNVPAGH